MNIQDLNNKKVIMLGFGREGQAMVEAIEKYAPDCVVTIGDQNEKLKVESAKLKVQLGDNWLDDLDRFDVVIKSPGIPTKNLPKTNTPVTNSTQIFLDSIDPDCLVIGITGSKGKSTTSSLIAHILQEAGKNASLVGNIGEPAIKYIEDGTADKIFVMELSSFQLEQLTRSPRIAVVTSFFPEHLDAHGTLENYKEAKTHCTKFQNADDFTFYFDKSEGAKDIAECSTGKKISYGEDDAPVAIIDTNLVGVHNLFNIAGATKVALHLGIDKEVIIKAVRSFEGLPHRLYNLGLYHSIIWIDDAISTTPDSTIAAIHALNPNIKSIIVGGKDRGLDFAQLGEVIMASSIKQVILLGESGPRIAEHINDAETIIHETTTMEEAVAIAKRDTKADEGDPAPICLLSPASPSYDIYKNFIEKGEEFKKQILHFPQ